MAAVLGNSVVAAVVRTPSTSNTASRDNHEKISSWVSFSFLYEYGAPLGGPSGRRSSAMIYFSLLLFLSLHSACFDFFVQNLIQPIFFASYWEKEKLSWSNHTLQRINLTKHERDVSTWRLISLILRQYASGFNKDLK